MFQILFCYHFCGEKKGIKHAKRKHKNQILSGMRWERGHRLIAVQMYEKQLLSRHIFISSSPAILTPTPRHPPSAPDVCLGVILSNGAPIPLPNLVHKGYFITKL